MKDYIVQDFGFRVMRILTSLYVVVSFCLFYYYPDWIYKFIFQNPILLFLLRGSLVFVIATPMVMLLIKEANEVTDKGKKKYKVIISIYMITCIVLFLSFFISIAMFQFLFGYFQSIFYNPLQIILPVLLALGLDYLLLRKSLAIEKKIAILSTSFAWVFVLLVLMSTLVIYQPPNNYNWYRNYLTQKYNLENVELINVSSRPKSETNLHPPPGLLLKYLFFGEHSVDSSCLND